MDAKQLESWVRDIPHANKVPVSSLVTKLRQASCLATDLQFDNERLINTLERLSQWAKAYPLEAFPEPDFAEVRKALKEYGISLDAISASNMRHVIKGVSDIVEQALKEK